LAVHVAKAVYSGNETQYLLTLPNRQTWKARVANGAGAKRFSAGEAAYVTWRFNEAVILAE
jgi:hypothetical protein